MNECEECVRETKANEIKKKEEKKNKLINNN